MIKVFTKPADQITLRDIESLIASRVPEGERIEYKQELPAKGGRGDPWMSGGDQIGDRAKDQILEETVAFANAYGGVCLLGIRESNGEAAVAEEISPIPRAAELAERLKMVFRDGVDPELPRIEIFAVPAAEDKSGVVIIRVGKSRLAPHRIKKTLVCPIRRQNRREKMTMREIQDMTLNLFRGTERLERRLSDRLDRFAREFERLETPDEAWGVRLTAIPVGDEIKIDRVIRGIRVSEEFDTPWRKIIHHTRGKERNLLSLHEYRLIPQFWRPMLRAARAELQSDSNENYLWQNCYREIHDDGLVEFGLVSPGSSSFQGKTLPNPLDPDLPVEMFANLVVWADRVRTQVHAPTVEYIVEVQFCARGKKAIISKHGSRHYIPNPPVLPEGSKVFPNYSLGNADIVPNLIKLFHRDFWNFVGQDFEDNEHSFELCDLRS